MSHDKRSNIRIYLCYWLSLHHDRTSQYMVINFFFLTEKKKAMGGKMRRCLWTSNSSLRRLGYPIHKKLLSTINKNAN